jgi:hypothetical protein
MQEIEQSKSALTPTSLSLDESHKAYVSSLKSPITRKAYVIRLKNYLRSPVIRFSTFDELLNRERAIIEQGLIDVLIEMRYKRCLSYLCLARL